MSKARQRLVSVWLALMLLTITMAYVADVRHASRLGAAWLIAVGIVTVIKVRYVLGDYLRLRENPMALLAMTGAVVVTLAIVVGTILATSH